MAKGKFDMSEFLRPAAVPESDTGREQIVYLPLDQLRADENNFYSLDGIDELAANIELIGLQQPIRVRKDGDGYIIVSGQRRAADLNRARRQCEIFKPRRAGQHQRRRQQPAAAAFSPVFPHACASFFHSLSYPPRKEKQNCGAGGAFLRRHGRKNRLRRGCIPHFVL